MPNSIETLPARPLSAEQVTQIVNETLAGGRYRIEEVILAFARTSPVEVADLEERNKIESDRPFLITDLKTGDRYDFIADSGFGGWGFEIAEMGRLKAEVPVARLGMTTFDDFDGHWTHWYLLPEGEGSELDIKGEGQLDPLMYSIVSKLRQ